MSNANAMALDHRTTIQLGSFDWALAWSSHGPRYLERTRFSYQGAAPCLKDELLFCLLGGFGVPYELAVSAAQTLAPLRPFCDKWRPEELERRLVTELSRPQFEPLRNDGTRRKYRFPKRKARLITLAAGWIHRVDPLGMTLAAADDERERRR